MLVNMFIGQPPGNYDRLLDFSRAITGNLFFVPSVPLLESLASDAPAAAVPAPTASTDAAAGTPPGHDGSLGIGSLKGVARS
jgi:putative iron-dependent peroxidase